MNVSIEPTWKARLQEEFDKPYFEELVNFLKAEKDSKKIIYPNGSVIFSAFNTTPFDKTKIIILGQDPYHGAGQAMGLSFSVPKNTALPPSLQNIYKELAADLGLPISRSGDLTAWAAQGVLLLNAALTVRANEPNSHSQIGWQEFTDAVIRKLSTEKENLVFILWGKFAQDKSSLIDARKHLVLKAAHPSPFSVHKGFFGSKPFSKTNEYLVRHKQQPIDWKIND